MAHPVGDSEQLNFGKQERQPHASRIYLLTQQAEKLRDDPNYCEWEDGEVVSKYLDINWRPVELDMPASFNSQRQLSFSQLDTLSRVDSHDLVHFYGDVLQPRHFELIEKYRQTYYPELVATDTATSGRPAAAEEAEVVREPSPELPVVQEIEEPQEMPATDETVEEVPETESDSAAEVILPTEEIEPDEPVEVETAEPDPQADPPVGGPEEDELAEKPEVDLQSDEEIPWSFDLPTVETLEVLDIPIGDEFPPALPPEESVPADATEPVLSGTELPPLEEFMPSVVIVDQPQLPPAEKERLWTTVKGIVRDGIKGLGRKFDSWKKDHPEKLLAGGLVGTFLLSVSLFAGFDSESQPASTEAQRPAAVMVIDDTESLVEFSPPPAETAPLDDSLRTLDIRRPASSSLLAMTSPQLVSKTIELASSHEPALQATVPTTGKARPQPAVETADEASEPEDVQLTSTASAVSTEAEKEPAPVLRRSTVSLNADIVEKQLTENDDTSSSRQSEVKQPVATAQQAKVTTEREQQADRIEDGYSVTAEQAGWLKAAGIAASDWGFVDFIVTRESSWKWWVWSQIDPNSFGLPQRNFDVWPLKKGETFMNDPVAQLEWAADYAERRYGSWQKAADFHRRNKWW